MCFPQSSRISVIKQTTFTICTKKWTFVPDSWPKWILEEIVQKKPCKVPKVSTPCFFLCLECFFHFISSIADSLVIWQKKVCRRSYFWGGVLGTQSCFRYRELDYSVVHDLIKNRVRWNHQYQGKFSWVLAKDSFSCEWFIVGSIFSLLTPILYFFLQQGICFVLAHSTRFFGTSFRIS